MKSYPYLCSLLMPYMDGQLIVPTAVLHMQLVLGNKWGGEKKNQSCAAL